MSTLTRFEIHDPEARASTARVAAAVYAVGGIEGLMLTTLSGAADLNVGLIVTVSALGLLTAVLVWLGARRVSPLLLHVVTLFGSVLVLASLLYGGPDVVGTGAVSAMFVWIAVLVFYAFPTPLALAHTSVGAVGYAVALIKQDAPAELWTVAVMFVTTALLAGALVGWLVDRVHSLATTDPLTSLPNRRSWEHELTYHTRRALRTSEPLTVALLDLDYFKEVNDTGGHAAGDRLLISVTQAWRRELRAEDVLARIGGDEFALVLPATGLHEAHLLVERLRTRAVSFTAGLAQWDGVEDVDTFVVRADRALYAGKDSGRNRTHVDRGGRKPIAPFPH